MSCYDDEEQRRLQEQRESEKAELIAAEIAEAKRQQEIETKLVLRGHIIVEGHYDHIKE